MSVLPKKLVFITGVKHLRAFSQGHPGHGCMAKIAAKHKTATPPQGAPRLCAHCQIGLAGTRQED